MSALRNNYREFPEAKGVFFAPKKIKIVSRMSGCVTVVSTVCPDYPNNGKKYDFTEQLGNGVGLTTKKHLECVPTFIDQLRKRDIEAQWLILIADLPELANSQKEFYEKVAGSFEEYVSRCEESRKATEFFVRGQAIVETFSSYYSNLSYIKIQESVADKILFKAKIDSDFARKFESFMLARRPLAELFRGRRLTEEELRQAAAHGMSLYVTHGTLLRARYQRSNLIVINHETPNLSNFFASDLVPGYEYVSSLPIFPIGIIENTLY